MNMFTFVALAEGDPSSEMRPEKLEEEIINKEKQNRTRKAATKTSPEAHTFLDYRYKDILWEKLIDFEQQNSGATEDEINEFFVKRTKKYSD